MTRARLAGLTALAMLAFAGNSVLCRLALDRTAIDPASFMTIRLASAAALLWAIVRIRGSGGGRADWHSALVLFAYAVTFTYAYVSLPAATGALLLFGGAQTSMIGYGIARGERLNGRQVLGLGVALCGLVGLLLPGLTAPPVTGAVLMITAGVAWGAYSLLGRGAGGATATTAGNFARAAPLAALVSAATLTHASIDAEGLLYAATSGAITTGLGYIVWYAALPSLRATQASIVQLSVPVLTAVIGVVGLNEPFTLRLALTSLAILGGIALVIRSVRSRA